ncbi:glutamate-cysteine ligase [Amphibacillus marinus]|uniref:Glutamate--cysteine ligase n=1 Tax=Amphibacillus marinus TaxID=872970 RepID=A0A1H8R9U2_9BACI|nr:glutamate--cysteine ligase [Amphibacillus marinus]SEO63067.1 glutamate-cysteine ligase [Amphibacillus marinus]
MTCLNEHQLIKQFPDRRSKQLLLKGLWGIERETQRTTEIGYISELPHPISFGNKLTNKQITVDFSENQLEFVTAPHPSPELALRELAEIQAYAETEIGDELLWPFSMPPRLPDEEDIPIAVFPETDEGIQKEIYRRGLALRYGKRLQMISGIHYNFSFSQELIQYLYLRSGASSSFVTFSNNLYLRVSRQFIKHRWLLIYLFGASPVADSSYDSEMQKKLNYQCDLKVEKEKFNKYATSLRASRYGYSNEVEACYQVSYNHLADYQKDVKRLLATPSAHFAKLGMMRNGKQVQLNYNIIQNESEFYAPIRIKQKVKGGKTQLDAIMKRGIGYLEIRTLDIDPFDRYGIQRDTIHFVHLFLLYCLLINDEQLTEKQQSLANENHEYIALFGRKPTLKLTLANNSAILAQDWAKQILNEMFKLADFLDTEAGFYQSIVRGQLEKVVNYSLLPSQRIADELAAYPNSYLEFGIDLAKLHQTGHSGWCREIQ